ncbi:MAG: hypothetical protein LBR77_07735 [Lachnospiraceae bacterium]|jgi:H+/gluconate symporter-like permease|nr:hypothetical protein [Lachnospiraceae bacterium]
MDSAQIISLFGGYSLLGIVIGVVVFVVLAFKAFNLQLSALIAAAVMLLFAGVITIGTGDGAVQYTGLGAVFQGVFTTWLGGLANALKSYFVIFCAGAIFGKLLSDGGATKSIAFAIADAIRNIKNELVRKMCAAAFVPLLYIILSYCGISGFVMVFTVLGIGYELYKEMNIPWRLYCMGGASCSITYAVAGSIQVPNISAATITGSNDLLAGWQVSLICAVFFVLVFIVMLRAELKAAEKKGEGFMDTGAEFDKTGTTSGSREGLPNVILSAIPLVLVVVLCAAFKVPAGLALIICCFVCIIFFWKNLTAKSSLKKTISEGMVGAFTPMMSVCCAVALGAVIKILPGFQYLQKLTDSLPPLFSGTALCAVLTFILASTTNAIPAMGDVIHQKYLEAGLTNAMSHRLMLVSSAPFGIMFHNGGVVNASSLAKIPYNKAVSVYIRYSCLPCLPGLIIVFTLIWSGLVK